VSGLDLESVRGAVIAVDGSGFVHRSNGPADALLESGEGLVLREGRLAARQPAETAALHALVRRAIDWRMDLRGEILVSGRRDGRVLRVSARPLGPGELRPLALGLGALLLLSDSASRPLASEEVLRRGYGLTRAEARVASFLAQGETVRAISILLGVGRATVKSHLQQVLWKTGTHRQAELVCRLLTPFATRGAGVAPRSIASIGMEGARR
jgi:DNA-binding CsgD family transcriptional regulator